MSCKRSPFPLWFWAQVYRLKILGVISENANASFKSDLSGLLFGCLLILYIALLFSSKSLRPYLMSLKLLFVCSLNFSKQLTHNHGRSSVLLSFHQPRGSKIFGTHILDNLKATNLLPPKSGSYR